MSKYTLKFSGKKGSGDKTDFSVSSVQLINKETFLNVPNPAPKGLEGITFQLAELKYDKRNYSPCRVDAVVSVANCPLEAEMDEFTEMFSGKTVELVNQSQIQNLPQDPITVGSDYFVYQVKPVFQFDKAKGEAVPCTIQLVIYSRDYLLTIDRFSKSYLSRKLSADIIAETLKYSDSDEGGVLGKCLVDFEDDIKRLQFTTLDDKEMIQPYHVQYNEDFYSFIARIAARHGEFLFFEDGKLNLGLPYGKDAVSLDPRDASDNSKVPVVLSMEKETLVDSPLDVDSYYSNYLYREEDTFDTIFATTDVIKDQNAIAGKPIEVDPKKLYFNEDAYDEYFDTFGTTSETAPDGMIMEQGGGFWLGILLTRIIPLIPSTNHDTKFSRMALIAEALKEIALEEGSMAARVSETNDLYLKKRVNIPVAHKDEQYGGEDGDKLCQFGTYTGPRPEGDDKKGTSLQQYNFMRSFYGVVRETEVETSKRLINLKVRPGCAVLNVGDTVSFGNKKYVIVKVSAEYSFKPAADVLSIDVFQIDENKPVCPPYDKCSEHTKAAPQVAVVAAHLDPRYLNRVRIKYPWQPDSDMASPWVRTSSPLASPNGAGCSFVMKTGSEVMVDYIDGNIDRPYIVGSMFNTRNNPTTHPLYYGDREIRAESGARLKLGMGNIATHVNNFVPFMSAVTPFISPLMGDAMIQLANAVPVMGKAAGTATITDGFGLFKISGDTAARKVTIDSAIGKVTISALTGISVSAPFGDVTIEANNIKLKAANNITIESGMNIKDELDIIARQKRHQRLDNTDSTLGSIAKGAGDIAAKTVADLMFGAVDMSLLRVIYNAVMGPKEGTLKIKSHRFVNIEAGDGCAMDSAGGFAPKDFDFRSQIRDIDKFADCAAGSLKKRLVAIHSAYMTYKSYQSDRTHGLKKKADEIVKKLLGAGGGKFSDNELYGEEIIISLNYTGNVDLRQIITEGFEKSLENYKAYIDDYKKSSGTFREGLKPFTKAQQDILVDAMNRVYMFNFNEQGKSEGELICGLCEDPSLIDKSIARFRKAIFRMAFLRCVGTNGFCFKWNEGYNLAAINVTKDGVEPWSEPIRNIHIGFDDMSYKGHKVIRENFKNPFSLTAGSINSVWNPLQKGRVLISETPGTTLGITPNHNEWEAMDNQSVEFVRRYLAQK